MVYIKRCRLIPFVGVPLNLSSTHLLLEDWESLGFVICHHFSLIFVSEKTRSSANTRNLPIFFTTMEIKALSDLDDFTRNLIQRSVEARDKAYCPYSKFAVGSAIYCEDDGSIVTGCNVECIVLGLTNCAERTAVFKAVSEGKTKFSAIAVAAVNEDKIVSPCGQCRQMLAEFNPRIPMYLVNPHTNMVGCGTLEYFLPHSFNPENVKLNTSE